MRMRIHAHTALLTKRRRQHDAPAVQRLVDAVGAHDDVLETLWSGQKVRKKNGLERVRVKTMRHDLTGLRVFRAINQVCFSRQCLARGEISPKRKQQS